MPAPAADACGAPAPPLPAAPPTPAQPAGTSSRAAGDPDDADDRGGLDAVDTDGDSDAVAEALDWAEWGGPARGPNAQPPRASASAPPSRRAQPPSAAARALDAVFDGALRRAYHHAASDDGGGGDDDDDDGLNPFFDDDASHAAAAGARAAAAAPAASRAARRAGARRERDKSDRATVETVLDPRTRLVLFKLLNAGVFAAIHGCVSTGKEANVYFAVGGPASPHAALAVKVYKTSILAFKDRHRYVTGDYRYERGYGGGGNARRMVRLWAEKEARNLARLAAAGVPCPSVVTLRSHVLAMSFIGSDGEAAPRLKDARLSRRRAVAAHRDVLLSMRALYARARLVHADLSEYNLLYHEGAVIVIDVSQSVDLDHPRALDFLRRDAVTVASFFARRGVVTLSTRACFDFVTDPRPLSRAEEEAALDAALAAAEADEADGAADAADGADGANAPPTADDAADAVFMAAHIPRRLADVDDCERDAGRLAQGGRAAEGIFYQALAGMTQDMTRVVRDGGGGEEAEGGEGGDAEEAPSSSDDGDDATTSDDDDSDGDDDPASRPPRDRRATARACTLPPDEAAAARAERRAAKAVVKEAARERRTTKTPKHVKKRATKGKKKKK